MKQFRRVVLLVLVFTLVLAQAAVAQSLLDGYWKGNFTSKGPGAKAYGRMVKGYIFGERYRVLSYGLTQADTFTYNDGEIAAMITLDGVRREVSGTYKLTNSKVVINLSYKTADGKSYTANISGRRAIPSVTGFKMKKVKPGKTSNALVKANPIAEYTVLTDNKDVVIGIVDKDETISYTFIKGKNRFIAYAGVKDAYGAIPIKTQVGGVLSEADKALLSDPKKFSR